MQKKGDFIWHQRHRVLRKYHIVFIPKYRRKVIYNQYRNSLREILRHLCKSKVVNIIGEECYKATDI